MGIRYLPNLVLMAGALAVIGCGPVEREKGTGATGTLKLSEAKDSDTVPGIEIVNELRDKNHQKAFNLLHLPASSVLVQAAGPREPTLHGIVEAVKFRWDEIDFANVKQNKLFRYIIEFETTEGLFRIVALGDIAPNHVRACIALAKEGIYEGQRVSLENGRVVIGDSKAKPAFKMKREPCPFDIKAGVPTLLAKNESGDLSTPLCLQVNFDDSAIKKNVYTMIGFVYPEDNETLKKVAATAQSKPGSVKIVQVRVTTLPGELFEGNKPNLPDVSPDGKLLPPKEFRAGMAK